MRSKLLQFLPLITMASALLTSTATASTATVLPAGPVTGSAGTSQWVFNTARRTFNCTSTSFTGTLGSASGALPLTISSDVQWRFGGCRMTGGVPYILDCSTTDALSVTGATVGGVTPGRASLRCLVSLSATCRVNFVGSVELSLNDLGTVWTLVAAGQALVAYGSTCALLPNDVSMRLSDAAGSNLPFTVSPGQSVSVV